VSETEIMYNIKFCACDVHDLVVWKESNKAVFAWL